jgi:hypothetical protein
VVGSYLVALTSHGSGLSVLSMYQSEKHGLLNVPVSWDMAPCSSNLNDVSEERNTPSSGSKISRVRNQHA